MKRFSILTEAEGNRLDYLTAKPIKQLDNDELREMQELCKKEIEHRKLSKTHNTNATMHQLKDIRL